MSDQDGKRAQQEALRAAEAATSGDRAHEDALARYLQLQAAGAKKPRQSKKTTTKEGE